MNEWLLYQWLIEDILLIAFFVWQKKHVWDEPIKGGNGVTQSTEMAQVVLIYCLVYIVRAECRTQGSVIEPAVIISFILGVAALAGIKKGTFNVLGEKIKDMFGKETKGKKEEDI